MAKEMQLSKIMPSVLPDPLLSYRWIATAVPSFQFQGKIYALDPEYIESIDLPFNNVTAEGVFVGGGHDYFPGFHDVSAVSVNIYGDSYARALKYLWAWKRLVKNFDTGIYNLPSEYKLDWTVALLNPMGESVIEGKLIGTWPADTQSLPLSYADGTSRIIFSQNFSVDNMDLVFKV